MKAVVFYGVGDIRLADQPDPRINERTDAIATRAVSTTVQHKVREWIVLTGLAVIIATAALPNPCGATSDPVPVPQPGPGPTDPVPKPSDPRPEPPLPSPPPPAPGPSPSPAPTPVPPP
jgi:hypothetical protein